MVTANKLIQRIPARRDILLVFALCFTLIYTWSTLMFFNDLPSWILYLQGWSIAGIFAYSQLFALFESLVCLLILLLLAFILPARALRDQFVPRGTLLVTFAAAIAMAAHFTSTVPLWPSKKLIGAILFYLASTGASFYLLGRKKELGKRIESTVDRLSVLLYLYLPFVAISVIIIAVRNLLGIR